MMQCNAMPWTRHEVYKPTGACNAKRKEESRGVSTVVAVNQPCHKWNWPHCVVVVVLVMQELREPKSGSDFVHIRDVTKPLGVVFMCAVCTKELTDKMRNVRKKQRKREGTHLHFRSDPIGINNNNNNSFFFITPKRNGHKSSTKLFSELFCIDLL